MATVSVNLSKAAMKEWERIPRGKRSRVVTNYLVSRSLDAVDPTEGVSGHELAEMVIELRRLIDEGHSQRDALRAQVRHLEGGGSFLIGRGEE
jgi:KaiC/GvpD/RAD55 family RecA-like ATPase